MSADALIAERAAVGAIELATIARGVVVLDQMAKRAETTIVAARTLSPGRYWILVSGSVAEVEEAMDAARSVAGEDRVDDVLIHDPHQGLRDALAARAGAPFGESLLIAEIGTLCSTLLAVDRVLKESSTLLVELRLGAGLSGKGVFTLTGPLDMVEAARDVVEYTVPESRRIRLELIAQPHPDLPRHLLGAEHSYPRG